MDIGPTAPGHVLVIPKFHGAKLHDIPDDHLAELLPVAKKIAIASGLNTETLAGPGYNILQNNGSIAHQVVDHVHVHMIPKRDEPSGLQVGWPQDPSFKENMTEIHKDLVAKLEKL